MRFPSFLLCSVPSVLAATLAAQAPTATPAASATPPPYTIHTGTRLVVTDVTVTDKNGNPVQGLGREAFHIFDDGRPQKLQSFEEHAGVPVLQTATPAAGNTVNNGYLLHPPPVFNVLLIDNTTLEFSEQAYLAQELKQMVLALPPGQLLAVFGRDGLLPYRVQDFTSDHGLLLAAIERAAPHLSRTEAQYATDSQALLQMEDLLEGLPGRKNLLWLSGGSNVVLRADPGSLPSQVDMRPVYDRLEASRIAVYPIDARGLTVAPPVAEPHQHLLMEDFAEATGGQATYYDNFLGQAALHSIDVGSSFYTLTYSPHDLHFDNKWHKVSVQVEGHKYLINYRHGYYDDGNNLSQPDEKPRKMLLRTGDTYQQPSPDRRAILFEARVQPTLGAPVVSELAFDQAPPTPPPAKHEVSYNIHFRVPVSEFSKQAADGTLSTVVRTSVEVRNHFGNRIGGFERLVTLKLDPKRLAAHPNGYMSFDQQINLPDGADYLDVRVWDPGTGRTGEVHAVLTVEQPRLAACADCGN